MGQLSPWVTTLLPYARRHAGASGGRDLRGDVVVGEVQACERGQQGDLLRDALDLVVPELQEGDGRQAGQLLRLQPLDLVVAQVQLLQTDRQTDRQTEVKMI